MKKWIWIVVLSLFSTVALAADPIDSAKVTHEWGQVAKDIGEAIGIAARGVTAIILIGTLMVYALTDINW